MQELIKDLFNCVKEIQKNKKEYSDVYKIHKYWARKPWNVVAEYIDKYSSEGDLVIDPFCGSGLTGAESILQNRNFLGIDLNPMATMITKGTLQFCDIEELNKDFKTIEDLCKEEIMNLYKTEVCYESSCTDNWFVLCQKAPDIWFWYNNCHFGYRYFCLPP